MHPYTRKGHPHQANLLKQEAWRERACPWNICAEAHYFTLDLPLQRFSPLGKPITGSHAKGARNAEAEIVCDIQRGYECRATQQFARAGTYSAFPQMNVNFERAGLLNTSTELPLIKR